MKPTRASRGDTRPSAVSHERMKVRTAPTPVIMDAGKPPRRSARPAHAAGAEGTQTERRREAPSIPESVLLQLPLALVLHDASGRLLFANTRARGWLGTNLTHWHSWRALLRRSLPAAADRYRVIALLRRVLYDETTLKLPPSTDIVVTMPDRRAVPVRLEVRWLAEQGLFATTAQQLSALASPADPQLEAVFESLGDAMITADPAGRITAMNSAASRITGWDAKQAVGEPIESVFRVGQPRRSPTGSLIRSLLDNNNSSQPDPLILHDRRGIPRSIDLSVSTIRQGEGDNLGTVIVFRDITQRRELESRVRQTEKLDALGQLVGGIAHEFNNLLAGTLGYAELLGMRLDSLNDPEYRHHTDGIIQTTRQAAELVSKLLAFAREYPREAAPVDVCQVLSRVREVMSHLLDESIQVRLECPTERLTVRGDAQQIHDAVVNLALNARDAMPSGGHLTFMARATELSEDFCRRSLLPVSAGPFVELAVTDTGTGIPPHVLGHVFEPFFTTKHDAKGSGLGLSAVYGTVRDHGGTLSVESRVGRGTAFHLFLPLHEGRTTLHPSAASGVVHGKGRILLVDDEPTLRRMGSALLTRLGYQVFVAADGEEALKVFREKDGAFDLVLLDIIMPRMGGREALRELRRAQPDLRALYVSGFGLTSEDPAAEDGVHGVVRKPFTAATLSQKVAEALASPPPTRHKA